MSYFIRQMGDKDCGIACVKMLLAIVYKNKDYLYYPQSSKNESISLYEVMRLAKKEGMTLSASRVVNLNELYKERINSPMLVTLVENKELHVVLIKKVRRNKVLVYDPKRGIYWSKKKDFNRKWNGYILTVDKAQEVGRYHVKKLNIIPKTFMLITVIFQFLSIVSLFLAMSFLDGANNYILPLCLFGAYVLFEFVYQRFIMMSLKYFDNAILVNDYVFDREHFKDYYEPMSKFKVILISTPIKLVSSIVVIVFGIFILGINSLYNLAILGILFTVQGLFKLADKYYINYHRNDLEVLERDLFLGDNLDDKLFKNKVTQLNHKTYNLVSYMNMKKYFLIFLTIALCLVYQGLTGFMSINFMLFHAFLYMFMEENFDKVLETSEIRNQYRYYKCLYLYHFR